MEVALEAYLPAPAAAAPSRRRAPALHARSGGGADAPAAPPPRPPPPRRIAARRQLLTALAAGGVVAPSDSGQAAALHRLAVDAAADALAAWCYAASTTPAHAAAGLGATSAGALLHSPAFCGLLAAHTVAPLPAVVGTVVSAALTRIVAAAARGEAPPLSGAASLTQLFREAPAAASGDDEAGALLSELRAAAATVTRGGAHEASMGIGDDEAADDGDDDDDDGADAATVGETPDPAEVRLLPRALGWAAGVALPFAAWALTPAGYGSRSDRGDEGDTAPPPLLFASPPPGVPLVFNASAPVAGAPASTLEPGATGRTHDVTVSSSRAASSSTLLDLLSSLHATAHAAVFAARCEGAFGLLRDYPQSLPALTDVRDCLAHLGPPARARLAAALTAALRSRLLHAGVATPTILELFLTSVRALRAADPTGIVLPPVVEAVGAYLRSRPDAVRAVVSSLVDDADSALHAELVAKRPSGGGGASASAAGDGGMPVSASLSPQEATLHAMLAPFDADEDAGWLAAAAAPTVKSADGDGDSDAAVNADARAWVPTLSPALETALLAALGSGESDGANDARLPPWVAYRAAAARALGYRPVAAGNGPRALPRHAFGAAAYPAGYVVSSGSSEGADGDALTPLLSTPVSSSAAVTTALHFLLPPALHAVPPVARPFPPPAEAAAGDGGAAQSTSPTSAAHARLWQPPPVEAAPGASAALRSDFLSLLVALFGSSDALAGEYRSLLGERLLAKTAPDDFDTEADDASLELLKLRFGSALPLLVGCEIMLRDVVDSKRVMKQVLAAAAAAAATGDGAGAAGSSGPGSALAARLREKLAAAPPRSREAVLGDADASEDGTVSAHTLPALGATIVSHAYWPPPPKAPEAKAPLHPALAACFTALAGGYADVRKPRHLEPLPALGSVTLEVELPPQPDGGSGSGGVTEVVCTPHQATLLLHLAEAEGQHAPLPALAAALKLPPARVLALAAFWTAQRVVTLARGAGASDVDLWLTAAMPPAEEGAGGGASSGGTAGAAASASLEAAVAAAGDDGAGGGGDGTEDAEATAVHESYVLGMLGNLGPLPVDRIHATLGMFASMGDHPYERTTGQTARFLAALARDGKVEALDGGLWRLKA